MQVFYNFIAIFIRVAANSLSNVFQKKLAFEGENPVIVNFINYSLLSLLSVPLLFFVDYSAVNLTFLLYALAGGLTGAVCNCFMVMALEKGELSVLGPINSYKAVIGLIFGMFILHEIPNMYGIMGILLIISGSYFILESPGALMKKDIQYRIYALIFSAIEAVFIKKVIILSSITASFITSSFLGAIFSFIIMNIFSSSKLKLPVKRHSIMYVLTALCFGLMTFTTAYVFKYMNVGCALSLFQLSIIINVILGYKLFNEKNLIKKLFGSLIILIGSATILIFGH
ncbi:MAG TPA: EamA family transporter [Candidatus Stercorousia faecigallinarum]|nr:EamA family transporter [Candidatus Stercorousia faecigallinarum]